MSPTLFGLYINDLIEDVKGLDLGIPTHGTCKVSILVYADDVVILTENEKDLQKNLDEFQSGVENGG